MSNFVEFFDEKDLDFLIISIQKWSKYIQIYHYFPYDDDNDGDLIKGFM